MGRHSPVRTPCGPATGRTVVVSGLLQPHDGVLGTAPHARQQRSHGLGTRCAPCPCGAWRRHSRPRRPHARVHARLAAGRGAASRIGASLPRAMLVSHPGPVASSAMAMTGYGSWTDETSRAPVPKGTPIGSKVAWRPAHTGTWHGARGQGTPGAAWAWHWRAPTPCVAPGVTRCRTARCEAAARSLLRGRRAAARCLRTRERASATAPPETRAAAMQPAHTKKLPSRGR